MKGKKTLRLNKFRQMLAAEGLEAMIVTSGPNIYYLSGFTGTDSILLITRDHNYLITDFRYIEQAQQEAPAFEIVRADKEAEKVLAGLCGNVKQTGFEEEKITWSDYTRLEKALAGKGLTPASHILREMRAVKDATEIQIIREAVRITDQAFAGILKQIKPGKTEEEIAVELEFSLRRRGASGRSFDYIVASGPRGALPHGTASTKRIAEGEMLTLDFGALYQWYCSDFTRTVMVGRPDSKQKEIYQIVLEAQLAAIAAIKPGISGREVDAVARGLITKAGYGEYFGHGLGHSLGLEIHESPRFNTREDKLMVPGMVMTVEPGIYLPGWGGIRIEDVVLVTNTGVEVLTQAPKQCIIID